MILFTASIRLALMACQKLIVIGYSANAAIPENTISTHTTPQILIFAFRMTNTLLSYETLLKSRYDVERFHSI